ncbi:penicillin acylase family protein [Mycobacterium sp. KBS0706]|uniref:penicillin acylase family protein n=1 Tax=Mycobacterium sp. KBS0706 TaxID=2578109 RepID=UPI00110FE8F4|nr:penicillin acylase family protein [Mycobacterium sp. KBS0706]TSD83933.1 penicillin acylase family protein [Mycobacterium sp. KBS0706]
MSALHRLIAVLAPLVPALRALAPRPVTAAERLAAFPTSRLPLSRPVDIRWNAHQIPFVEAETDGDLAVALGLVHAHLRGGQIALMKRVAQGRLSEIAGPVARDIDHALRILDYGHAADAVIDRMPADSRAFAEAFVTGVNAYHALERAPPPEFALLGLRHEPYTLRDMWSIGRLAGSDINWLAYFGLLRERGTPGFAEAWARTLKAGANAVTSFASDGQQAALATLLTATGRTGSNSVAVAATRSATGGAMIASDPHLSLSLPNLWLVAGMRSPGYRMAGLMVPGMPFVAVGRSLHLAWGGTNMRAASSDLYNVSALPPEEIETRETVIRTRFWRSARRKIRRSRFGPIVSDAKVARSRPGDTIALRWIGHEPTDEVTALLRASRATTPEEFRAAFAGFGVSAQNMLVAGADGRIGQIMAATLPVRTRFPPPDPVLDAGDPDTHWQGLVDAPALPWTADPLEGLLATANNRPTDTTLPVGFFFSADERVRRLYALLRSKERLIPEDLAALQADTVSPDSGALARRLVEAICAAGIGDQAGFLDRLAGWDGDYAAGSAGAPAFEALLHHLVPRVYGADSHDAMPRLMAQWNAITAFLADDLGALAPDRRRQVLAEAVGLAAIDAAPIPSWGEMHRMRVAHILAALPVLGRFFVFGDYPTGGSRETPMKTAHGLVRGRHNATYGSMARHVADMSDPDASWVTLFGGQDGWLGSEGLTDQIPLWRERRSIRLPLRPETVAREFPTLVRLSPR